MIPNALRWLNHYPAKDREQMSRTLILKRDGFKCCRCGATDDLTIDHIRPRSKGGADHPSNLQTLCRGCNSQKGTHEARFTTAPPLDGPARSTLAALWGVSDKASYDPKEPQT